jgi:8-oxo-dGTP diphosphatase
MKTCTLLFLLRDDEILLAMKKRGFGTGHWNGVGGKIEPGETLEQAAIRECQEEIGVTPHGLEKVAVHDFVFPEGTEDIKVHTFIAKTWEGEPHETEEMAPQWFKVSEIPYTQMWDDDIVWLPLVLQGKKLQTRFTFDRQNRMKKAQLEIVKNI